MKTTLSLFSYFSIILFRTAWFSTQARYTLALDDSALFVSLSAAYSAFSSTTESAFEPGELERTA